MASSTSRQTSSGAAYIIAGRGYRLRSRWAAWICRRERPGNAAGSALAPTVEPAAPAALRHSRAGLAVRCRSSRFGTPPIPSRRGVGDHGGRTSIEPVDPDHHAPVAQTQVSVGRRSWQRRRSGVTAAWNPRVRPVRSIRVRGGICGEFASRSSSPDRRNKPPVNGHVIRPSTAYVICCRSAPVASVGSRCGVPGLNTATRGQPSSVERPPTAAGVPTYDRVVTESVDSRRHQP